MNKTMTGAALDPMADLSKRERLALRHGLRGDASAPAAVVRRLERLGLAVRTGHMHQRTEWQAVVAVQPAYYLTPAGESAARSVLLALGVTE